MIERNKRPKEPKCFYCKGEVYSMLKRNKTSKSYYCERCGIVYKLFFRVEL